MDMDHPVYTLLAFIVLFFLAVLFFRPELFLLR